MTREDSIAAVMAAADNHGQVLRSRATRAAIEQALRDERIRTLEAVGCGMIWEDGRDCTFADVSLEEACDRCRMLAEAKGEGHPS